jgi:drug/metabolite transporter (DMT)-like permease
MVRFLIQVVLSINGMALYWFRHNMRPTRVSLSLLGQPVIHLSLLAWVFLDEKISLNMIIGGLILLWVYRLPFTLKTL